MITVIKNRKKTNTYCARIYLNGKRISQTFNTKRDAKLWESQQLADRSAGKLGVDRSIQSLTLKEFAARWFKEKVEAKLSLATQAAYRADVENHLLPLFGHLLLREINSAHASQLIAHLKARGQSPKTVNDTFGVLKSILNDAVRWQCLDRNVLFSIQGLKEAPSPEAYWTEGQVEQFLEACHNNPLLPLFIFTLNTGMRRGEICALKWDRVSFPRNQIEVTRSVGRYGLRETTKNGKKRIIPMNQVVRDLLYGFRKEMKGEFVFCKEDGSPLDAAHLYRDFQRAQERAKMETTIRFHDLRHTYASNFMMKGGGIYDLQKILGHSSLEMTQRYAHLSPMHLAKAVEIISFGGNNQKFAKNLEPDEKKDVNLAI